MLLKVLWGLSILRVVSFRGSLSCKIEHPRLMMRSLNVLECRARVFINTRRAGVSLGARISTEGDVNESSCVRIELDVCELLLIR